MEDALNPDNKGRFVAEAARDYAAEAVSATRKQYERDYGHQDMSSFLWSARLAPTDPVEDQGN